MINLKTTQEIELMKEGGAILRKVVEALVPTIQEGMTTHEVDKKAEELILSYGAYPSFKTVKGYSWTTCLPVNEQAVHTPPSLYVLKNGDVLTIDIGVLHKGFHTDYATSILIGNNDKKKEEFLRVGQETLEKAISKIKEGIHLGEIGEYVEETINEAGYFILRDLTGHGIGKKLHEDPYVLNYLDRPVNKTYKVKNGLTIAVEIIYSMGTEGIAYEKGNSWSIVTDDKSLAACFERTIAIDEGNTFILT